MSEVELLMPNGAFCVVETYYDEENNFLHILDLNYENTMTLTNAVSNQYIEIVRKAYKNKINRIFLYHTDNTVTEWEGFFKHIDKKNNDCHLPFIEYIETFSNKRVKGKY